MGCDGGTTACERKYLRSAILKRKEARADPNEIACTKVKICAMSNEPLKEPVRLFFSTFKKRR